MPHIDKTNYDGWLASATTPRLIRVTEGQRAAKTTPFERGLLIYITDTKKLFMGDGETVGGVQIVTAAAAPTPPPANFNYTITEQDGAFRLSGTTGNNPTIVIEKGQTYEFTLSLTTLQIYVKNAATNSLYNTGLSHVLNGTTLTGSAAQGKSTGLLRFEVPETVPAQLTFGDNSGTPIFTVNVYQAPTTIGLTLDGDIDLNSHDITGTGDINITGTIAASGLIDAQADVNVGQDLTVDGNATVIGNLEAETITANTGFVGDLTGNVTGNLGGIALSAQKLQNIRTIALTGDITGSATFDGTANATLNTTLNRFRTFTGTTYQINVATDANGDITLSTPQNLHTNATPIFDQVRLNNDPTLNTHAVNKKYADQKAVAFSITFGA